MYRRITKKFRACRKTPEPQTLYRSCLRFTSLFPDWLSHRKKISRESLGFIFFLSFSLKLLTNLRWSVRIEILYRGSQSCQENIMNVARISKTYPQRRRWATHIAPLVCLWGACGPELQQRGIFSIVYNRSFIWKKTISVLRRRKWWDLNERWTTTVKFS